MNRKYLIIVSAFSLLSGILFYSLNTSYQAYAQQTVQGHKGHAAETQPQAQIEQVEQKAEEGEELPTVEIPTDKQQLIGVKTVKVSIKPLQKIIRTVGRIEYDERKIFTINTKFEGWIDKLYVDYTGRYIKKGEPVAEIYSPELFATQQEFLNLLKWNKSNPETSSGQNPKSKIEIMLSKDADAIIEAAKQRLRLWDISDEQIERIRETGTPFRTLVIYSPAEGYVVEKMAVKGMRVMPGDALFNIADLSTLWIIADAYEYELPLVKPGQKAKITLSYFPEKEFSAVIDYVYPSISGVTRTAKIRFEIPNYKGQLKPQMFTNIEIKVDLGRRLAIPDDAVIDTGTRQIVYVDKGEGYFEPREVMLGLRADGFREVLKGLKRGEKVASSATFLIDSEAQLKGIKPLGGYKH